MTGTLIFNNLTLRFKAITPDLYWEYWNIQTETRSSRTKSHYFALWDYGYVSLQRQDKQNIPPSFRSNSQCNITNERMNEIKLNSWNKIKNGERGPRKALVLYLFIYIYQTIRGQKKKNEYNVCVFIQLCFCPAVTWPCQTRTSSERHGEWFQL